MGYKSEKTLGLVKGNARLNENAIFNDIYNKTKSLLEGEDIEDQDAPEKDAGKVVSQSKEAKKHVEGSVSNDKGTQAPKPKTGSMESLDDAKSQAPEAKKNIEGSVESKLGMGLGVNAKEGNWNDISVPQAADAKKHITMSETVKKKNKVGIQLGENYFEEMEMPEEMPSEEPQYEENVSLNDILGKLNLAVTTEDDNHAEALIKSALSDLGEKIVDTGKQGLKQLADFLRNQFDKPVDEGMYGEGMYGEGVYEEGNEYNSPEEENVYNPHGENDLENKSQYPPSDEFKRNIFQKKLRKDDEFTFNNKEADEIRNILNRK